MMDRTEVHLFAEWGTRTGLPVSSLSLHFLTKKEETK